SDAIEHGRGSALSRSRVHRAGLQTAVEAARVGTMAPAHYSAARNCVQSKSRMSIQRRQTRKVIVGDDRVGRIGIGGDAPVSVQTMTAGYTHEIDKCVAEIQKLAAAGADL